LNALAPEFRTRLRPAWLELGSFWFQPAIERLRRKYRGPAFTLRLWDSEELGFGYGAPTFVVHFRDARSLLASMLRGSLGFGEAYAGGSLTLDGNLEDALTALTGLYHDVKMQGPVRRLLLGAAARTLTEEKSDIRHHYDIGDEFYRYYLDPKLQYSCAYFHSPDDTLEQAQEQKIRHTVAKLRLERGQRLLDIGCGWGHLMMHAAEKYGVSCFGITLSENQAAYIRQQVRERRLPVEVRVMNYLELDAREKWDRLVSVGMMCHIGERRIEQFWDKVTDLLSPGGVALLHCIAKMRERPGADPFVEKYVFPGYWFNSLEGMTWRATDRGLHVLDVENLRRHYALTAHHWGENFRRNWSDIRERFGFDERFMRTWEFYLASVVAGFRSGWLHLIQMVVSRGVQDAYPLTRRFLYAPDDEAPALAPDAERSRVPGAPGREDAEVVS
jgi:cyclopropane-fatty-acyl-phospholipid synthase